MDNPSLPANSGAFIANVDLAVLVGTTSSEVDYDVIVVGGGPAGCAFVRSLITLRSRLRVLLIDKDRFPRDKVCGDGLSYQAIPAIRKIFPELGSLTPSASFTDQQTLCYPRHHRFFRRRQALDVIPRAQLDNALWQAAVKAGAETLENTRVTELLTNERGVCGVQLQDSNGARKLSCRLVIGADGSRSIVRQATGSIANDYLIHALRQYVRGIPRSTEGLIFFFDLKYLGYFWIFPFNRNGERWANVGYGNARNNKILKDRFWHYFKTPGVQEYLGGGQLDGNLIGFPLNMAKFKWNGRLTRPLAGPGYFLLGDSAALIHPLSGEGIAFAIESGAIAADVLNDNRISEARKGVVYERRVLRRVRPQFLSPLAFCAIRLPALLPRALSNAFVAVAAFAQKIFRFSRRPKPPVDVSDIGRWTIPPTTLSAAFILSLFLIALGGFWLSYALGQFVLPANYSLRAVVFAFIGSLFCLLDGTGRYGWSFTSAFLGFTILISAVVEFLGIKTGAIFGAYHYNAAMPAQLFGILPVVVPFGWFIFSYLCFATANELGPRNESLVLRAAIASALLVAYDLVSDPNQVYRGLWKFRDGGFYYGVPAQNFAAWVAVGFLALLALQFIYRWKTIVPEEEVLPPLAAIAFGAILLHEAIFALFITKAPIAAASGLVTIGVILVTLFVRMRRS